MHSHQALCPVVGGTTGVVYFGSDVFLRHLNEYYHWNIMWTLMQISKLFLGVRKDNISLKHIYNLPKIWLKVVTRALSHCLYINHLSQFARAIQIFGRWWICFKDILSLCRLLFSIIELIFNLQNKQWNCSWNWLFRCTFTIDICRAFIDNYAKFKFSHRIFDKYIIELFCILKKKEKEELFFL